MYPPACTFYRHWTIDMGRDELVRLDLSWLKACGLVPNWAGLWRVMGVAGVANALRCLSVTVLSVFTHHQWIGGIFIVGMFCWWLERIC